VPRIYIIGCCGAGKTTLAKNLSQHCGIPHVELDALYWLPQWNARSDEELQESVSVAVADKNWVMDGNYGQVREAILGRATMLIWLNYSFPFIFGRLTKRTARRVLRQERLFAKNRESVRRSFFSRDSILFYLIQTYSRRRREYRKLFNDDRYAHLQRIEISQPRDAEALLERSFAPVSSMD